MKKYLSIVVLLSLFVVGCSEQIDINSPVEKTANKKVKWLTIPNSGLAVEGTKTWSKTITGSIGGLFKGTKSLSSTVSAYVEVWVPGGSFSGTKTISATLNSSTLYADFAPSPTTFNMPIYYTVEYFGVNLNGVDPNNVDFCYIDGSGNMVKAEYAELFVEDGWICVVDAKLPHFSRYGFVN